MGGTEFEETVLTSGIGNIPPDDIESITVLKDAAAIGDLWFPCGKRCDRGNHETGNGWTFIH